MATLNTSANAHNSSVDLVAGRCATVVGLAQELLPKVGCVRDLPSVERGCFPSCNKRL